MADLRVASIPLLCSICPKRPKFSDPSHLLTHVASKGHLSNQFKVSVRTSTDKDAKDKLDIYNYWYEKYGIEQLLSQRMKKKDAKNAKGRSNDDASFVPPAKQARARESDADNSRSRNSIDNHIDPRLSYGDIKNEDQLSCVAEHHAQLSQLKANMPRMHLWSTTSDRPTPYHSPSVADDTVSDDCSSDPMVNPIDGSHHGYHQEPFGISDIVRISSVDKDVVSEVPAKGGAEISLKGTCWPGMDIFDSATPEMKRKRNQKKDRSLALQLEISSTQVEATEQMFGNDGLLQMERPISRLLEDSPSRPYKFNTGQESLQEPKAVLHEASVNVPRIGKGTTRSNAKEELAHAGPVTKRARTTLPRSLSTSHQYRSIKDDDESEEFNLTVGQGAKKKRDVIVFADADAQARVPLAKINGSETSESVMSTHSPRDTRHFGDHRGFALLNSAFPLPSPTMPATSDPFCDTRPHQSSNTLYRVAASPTSGKENTSPTVGGSGTADGDSAWVGLERNHRYLPAEGVHPTYFYHSRPHHPELGAFGGSNVYGFSSNPLAFGFRAQQALQPTHDASTWPTMSSMHHLASQPHESFREACQCESRVDESSENYMGTCELDCARETSDTV